MKLTLILVFMLYSMAISAQPVKIQGGAFGGGDNKFKPLRPDKDPHLTTVIDFREVQALDQKVTASANEHLKKCLGKQFETKLANSVDFYQLIILQENLNNPFFLTPGFSTSPDSFQCPYKSKFETNCLQTIAFCEDLKKLANDPNYPSYIRIKLQIDSKIFLDLKKRFLGLCKSK